MSGIDRAFVENQDMDTFFDLVEKVIEVNDIEKLLNVFNAYLHKWERRSIS